MKKVLQFAIAVLASIHLAGGPYALPQAFAWAGMLVNYSKTDGLAKAAVDTFSGEKPCELCCQIKEAKREDEKKSSPGAPEISKVSKLAPDLLPAEDVFVKNRMATDCIVAVPLPPALVAGIGSGKPLLQPPRVA